MLASYPNQCADLLVNLMLLDDLGSDVRQTSSVRRKRGRRQRSSRRRRPSWTSSRQLRESARRRSRKGVSNGDGLQFRRLSASRGGHQGPQSRILVKPHKRRGISDTAQIPSSVYLSLHTNCEAIEGLLAGVHFTFCY